MLDLLQAERHLELLHLRAPDLVHAQVLQDFAEAGGRARCGPARSGWDRTRWMTRRPRRSAIAAAPSACGPSGVPLWRDGTAPFGQSLYYRGVWAALALLIGLGSVSMAVFNSGRLTLVHIAIPAVLCTAGALFAIWQILLIVRRGAAHAALAVRRCRRRSAWRRSG